MKHNYNEDARKFIWTEILTAWKTKKLTDDQISDKLGISLSKFKELIEKYKKELSPDRSE